MAVPTLFFWFWVPIQGLRIRAWYTLFLWRSLQVLEGSWSVAAWCFGVALVYK